MTSVWSDKRGQFSTAFSIPASEPGRYRLLASVQGTAIARANYLVSSQASLIISAVPSSQGELVHVRGVGFVPDMKLRLVAVPDFGGAKSVRLGDSRAGSNGKFSLDVLTTKLLPGTYILRVWSANALGAELANAFFEVSV